SISRRVYTSPGRQVASSKADRSWITPEIILKSAQPILQPYKLDYAYCDWWTAYQIGQRVGDRFSLHERVFLAGDAVHTHSPKAGQGMNVSMQDTVNYGASLIVAKEGDTADQGNGTDVSGNQGVRISSKPEPATKIDIGKRMPSFKVLSQADARPWHLQELLKSNRRWQVIIFPGRLTKHLNMQRL
ncbi:phenol 2-monooxygenase, partial [Aspergillus udagawae]